MFRKLTFTVFCITILLLQLIAQTKSLQAVKVQQPPKLDGKLDDAVWQNVMPAVDFIMNFPDFGKPASLRSEVKIIYDDEAIYVGAHLFDDPKLVRRQLTERDREQFKDADNFGVAFDTYKDKQNAFQFLVTSANVQSDVRISSTLTESNDGDDNNGFDYNWDAVWDSRTSITTDGWIVEMKIPYSALRFSKTDIQDWGINISRYIRRFNEQSYWSPVDRKISGYVNQFGDLKGLQNLSPPLRLSFLPYLSGGYSSVPTNSGTINQTLHNGGMDLKYGINESFTVDMTLVPDFGQVKSDNIVLNLTPFEQQYDENRPFFTEGTELFNKAGIFYSRRIGETPTGYYDALQTASDSGYSIVRNPSRTQLYNATKFSGRTKNNLGIGVFNAVSAPMYAQLRKADGSVFKMQTEPLTNYNVIVLDQALKNRSSITFTNTNVIRSGAARDGNVSALQLSLFDKKNIYNFESQVNYSHVTGADAHNGYKTYLALSKVSGIWQWDAYNQIESENYDPNDLGILRSPNEITSGAEVSWNQFTPNKTFNFRNYNISIEHTSRMAPFSYQTFEISGSFLHVFKNFWDVSIKVSSHPFWENDFYELRRQGFNLKKSPYTFIGLDGSTDSRKRLFVNYFLGFADGSPAKKDPFFLLNLGTRYRFSNKFSVNLRVNSQDDKGNFGAVINGDGSPLIINDSSIIGRRRIKQFTTNLSATYNFKARMSLSVNVRHYWSKVQYDSTYAVKADGYWVERAFIPGYDQNFNAFNMDLFFTWDFRLGSRLIVAWKNGLGPDADIQGTAYSHYGNNLKQVLNVPHSNELTVKFIYYIDAQQLFKKKTAL